ncbi:sulfurtransferase TusA [Alkanindiges sp. WGS2144]|uniref:sulfurtransferase TusA n=1 Tax=Alkanindiges sp. WGS2144 TaxID=3366808 RepID=UPI003750738A
MSENLPESLPENLELPASDILLDTQGLYCPEPVMMLHQAVRKSQTGQVIQVIATDPSTTRDIPKFCTHLGHQLIEQYQQDVAGTRQYLFWVKKG